MRVSKINDRPYLYLGLLVTDKYYNNNYDPIEVLDIQCYSNQQNANILQVLQESGMRLDENKYDKLLYGLNNNY